MMTENDVGGYLASRKNVDNKMENKHGVYNVLHS